MMGTLGLFLLLLPLAAPLIAQDSMQHKEALLETKECEFFNKTCEENGNNCPTVEHCNLSNQSHKAQCFVAWTNSSERGPEVTLKGCFYYDATCRDKRKCITTKPEDYTTNGTLNFYCCCHGNNCNSHFSYEPQEELTTLPKVPNPNNEILSAVMIIIGALFIIFVFVTIAFYCYRKQKLANFVELPTIDATAIPQPRSTTNIMRPIKILENKAFGRFGGVWKAECDSQTIAVKIFPVQDQQSWMVEKEIYSLPQMNHENVLYFMGVEKRGEGANLQLWILTAFHEYGSIYDYLKGHVISWPDLCQIGETMALGLEYLHTEHPATKLEGLKPPIAHRDFKSKNVLLKSNMTACIADFGLAMAFYPGQPQGDNFGQVGTRRYMAPEVLEGSIPFNREAFLPIDMYACSLVLWELVSRCTCQGGPVGDYQLPFEDIVGLHPTLDDMQECVVTYRKRPTLKENWNNHTGLREVIHIMQDSWDHDADARLTASCIAERFSSLSRQPQLVQTSLSIKEATY